MYEAAAGLFPGADLGLLAAAVADYAPAQQAERKIKKKEAVFSLELTKTVDIAATLGKDKRDGQLLVGFALETDNERENALAKLENKNLDLIVLNSLRDEGAGFGHETNRVTIFGRDGRTYQSGLQLKKEIARIIVDIVIEQFGHERKKTIL
jgi:phosphopantothenoylcysteine decarboxylase/phosphopantothenate--cysteine ligase